MLVQKAYASIIGTLACCLSDNFNLRPPLNEPNIQLKSWDMLCSSLVVTCSHETTCVVKATTFKPFLSLLEHNVSSPVKLGKFDFGYINNGIFFSLPYFASAAIFQI